MKKYTAVPQSYLLEQFQKWKNVLDHNGAGHIFFLPHTGLLYRAHQFVDWLSSENYTLPIIDLDLEMLTDPQSFSSLLDKNPTPALIVARKNFLGVDRSTLSQILQNYYTKNVCSLLIFHEGSPIEMTENTALPSVMFQNNLIYSLPDQKTAFEYMDNFARSNNLLITTEQKQEIFDLCGNQPWLTNEIIRLIGLSPGEDLRVLFRTDSVSRRIEYLWDHFCSAHQKALLEHNQTAKERQTSLQELVSFGYLQPKSYKPIGKWLSDAIKSARNNSIKISNDSLTVNGVELKYDFSPGELRILSILWQQKIVSRNEIAERFWLDETDDAYSDWALDQVISRLRKKISLHKLALNIKTKRGLGYEI